MTLGRMTKITRYLAVLVVLLPLTGSAAPDGSGGSRWSSASALPERPHLANPVNDARAIGESLRRLKFDVTELYDPDFGALNSGVRDVRHTCRERRCGGRLLCRPWRAGRPGELSDTGRRKTRTRARPAVRGDAARPAARAKYHRPAGSASSCWIAAETTRSSTA